MKEEKERMRSVSGGDGNWRVREGEVEVNRKRGTKG